MDDAKLAAALDALPEKTRAAVKRLVLALKQQAAVRRLPPVMRPSEPLTEAEKQDYLVGANGWANRTDITDGAEYIHQVRRGLRQP